MEQAVLEAQATQHAAQQAVQAEVALFKTSHAEAPLMQAVQQVDRHGHYRHQLRSVGEASGAVF